MNFFFSHKRRSALSAKERLQLVLVHDRTDLTPAELEALKDDLIQTISRHIEIDPDAVQIGKSAPIKASNISALIITSGGILLSAGPSARPSRAGAFPRHIRPQGVTVITEPSLKRSLNVLPLTGADGSPAWGPVRKSAK